MLPSNLLITRRWRDKIRPVYAQPNKENLEVARVLVETYGDHVGKKKDQITTVARQFFNFFFEDIYSFEDLCKIIRSDNSSHWIMDDSPELIISSIREFVKR